MAIAALPTPHPPGFPLSVRHPATCHPGPPPATRNVCLVLALVPSGPRVLDCTSSAHLRFPPSALDSSHA